jgi:putative transposase
MRVEPYGVGSIVHITKRGTRGMNIFRDNADRERFSQILFYLNDSFIDDNWRKTVTGRAPFERPKEWPDRDPLVRILAWTLMPNHFHLLIEEIKEGGISKFMQRLCGSMSAHFNAKYKERGSIFQSAYRSRTVSEDAHLRYLVFYIHVKNVFELYPGGLARAEKHFDEAWEWALHYRFSSMGTYAAREDSPITESELIRALHSTTTLFKNEARELLAGHLEHHADDESLNALALEPW